MRPATVTLFLFIIVSGCKCKWRLAPEPTSLQYWSISDSKKNDAFVQQYKPQSPFMHFGGKNYYIDEAWVEHPYLQKNFYDKIEDSVYSFIMTFKSGGKKSDDIDLSSYIDGVACGMRIWFFMPGDLKTPDTIRVHYTSTLDLPNIDKTFLLFKK